MPNLSWLAVTIALAGPACGGDDGGSTGERLTQAAYNSACESAEDFLLDQYSGSYFVQAMCTAAAVENTSDAETCAVELQDCIENPPPQIDESIDAILSQAGCSAVSFNPIACPSTLDRLSDCLDALDAEIAGLEYTLTCASAGQTLSGWDIVELPAECEDLESDC